MTGEPIDARSKDDQVLFDTLEARGEASVRADFSTNRWGTQTRKVAEWLNLKEDARTRAATDLVRRNTEATESAADSAKRSAEAAEASAVASVHAARHARLAWIVALAGVLVSIGIAVFKK